MDYRQVNEDIKRGALNRAVPVLLCSEDLLLLDFFEKSLLESYGADPLDVSVFYGSEAEDDSFDEGIVGTLDTFPMLSTVRVAIVKDHPKLAGKKNKEGSPDIPAVTSAKNTNNMLAGYIAKMPETARLIFSSTAVNRTLALYKAIEKHGAAYIVSRLGEADLKQFSLKRFRNAGMEISPNLLHDFALATGYLEKDSDVDLSMVENDAIKLAYYTLAEGRKNITPTDLEECLPGVLRIDNFAMLDAISSGKKADAVRFLENALAYDENAMFLLLALLIGHFEIMLGYKELSAMGRKSHEITKALGQNSEWRVKKLGGFAQRFDKEKLIWILGRLYETDRDVKSGNIRIRDALTVLLAEI